MNLSKETYKKYAAARAPKSPILKNCLRAFLTGGLICTLGQGLNTLYTKACGMEKADAGTLTACTLVLIAAVLTGLGVFDRIGSIAVGKQADLVILSSMDDPQIDTVILRGAVRA